MICLYFGGSFVLFVLFLISSTGFVGVLDYFCDRMGIINLGEVRGTVKKMQNYHLLMLRHLFMQQ